MKTLNEKNDENFNYFTLFKPVFKKIDTKKTFFKLKKFRTHNKTQDIKELKKNN